MWEDWLVSLASPAVVIALVTLVLRVSPALCKSIANWVGEHITPEGLRVDCWLAHHVQAIEEHGRMLQRLESAQQEMSKDTIKNTILMLMNMHGDHRTEVRYELEKLERLGADCWIMDAARKYVIDGVNPLE